MLGNFLPLLRHLWHHTLSVGSPKAEDSNLIFVVHFSFQLLAIDYNFTVGNWSVIMLDR
jgi:hypothetical protein